MNYWTVILIFLTCLILNCSPRVEESYQNSWIPIDRTIVSRPSRFYAFTDPENPDAYNEIIPGNFTSLERSRLKPESKVIIILHAYGENALGLSTSTFLKNAYLKHGFNNIVLVQWGHHLIFYGNSDIFQKYNYAIFKNTPEEGRNIADFIAFLVNSNSQFRPENIHLIGTSVGANVAGATGYHLQKRHFMKLGRITGLDPPGVFLQFVESHSKLDRNDAHFVDILHTDIDLYGTPERMGHADFFANGGRRIDQPGCGKGNDYLTLIGIDGQDRENMCGHASAVFTYRKSLIFNLLACKCEKVEGSMPYYCGHSLDPANSSEWTTFGEDSKMNARGSYYLYA